MSGLGIQEFLFLNTLSLARERSAVPGGKTLFVSLNPDLTTDFGHFLNYERRLKDCCDAAGADYACFAHVNVQVELPGLRPVFPSDSGHYSMTRSDAAGDRRPIADEFWRSVDVALAAGVPDNERTDAHELALLVDQGSAAPVGVRWRCEQRVLDHVFPVADKFPFRDDVGGAGAFEPTETCDHDGVAHLDAG